MNADKSLSYYMKKLKSDKPTIDFSANEENHEADKPLEYYMKRLKKNSEMT